MSNLKIEVESELQQVKETMESISGELFGTVDKGQRGFDEIEE
jgi:hypothetical protein